MSRGRLAFTKVQKLQMLSSEVGPRLFVLPLALLLPDLVPSLSDKGCRLEFVHNDGVSTLCLCQRGDVRICRQ